MYVPPLVFCLIIFESPFQGSVLRELTSVASLPFSSSWFATSLQESQWQSQKLIQQTTNGGKERCSLTLLSGNIAPM